MSSSPDASAGGGGGGATGRIRLNGTGGGGGVLSPDPTTGLTTFGDLENVRD